MARLFWLGLATSASAQFKEGGSEPNDTKTGQTQVTRWRTGMTIKASGGACKGLAGYTPIPTDWPEQEVNTVNEEKGGGAQISYETVDGGAKIMTVRVGHLASGDEAKAIVTVEIRRSTILPPEKTDIYSIPDPAKLTRQIRLYLTPSPKIESRDPKIRELAKEVGADQEKAWDHVEAIYDWVRGKIKYQNGPLKGALAALKDGTGDCEEITSLFIAICRAASIPARSVWVPGHCYPEFYLVDKNGQGRWFPCQSAGKRRVWRDQRDAADLAEGRQFPTAQGHQGTSALHGPKDHRHALARRREAAVSVHRRSGGEVGTKKGRRVFRLERRGGRDSNFPPIATGCVAARRAKVRRASALAVK